MKWGGRILGVLAAVVAVAVHRRLPWIPVRYLATLLVLIGAAWRLARWRGGPRRIRWPALAAIAVALLGLSPVPWMTAELDDPPGSAWRLDGRFSINGRTVDPPGTWYWLTVGRPPILAEVVRGWFNADGAQSMLHGLRARRPSVVEPSAAAVGLRRAGWAVELGVLVEVSAPTIDGLPSRAVLSAVNGTELTTRAAWTQAVAELHSVNTITTIGGAIYDFPGETLPFRRTDVVDVPREHLDAVVGGWMAGTLPGSWFRNLALGSSHGLMVALVSYVHASHVDLAAGRTIAGTGTIRGDGSVGTIGGLWAKATAARQVGADILLFPVQQLTELDGFEAGSMRLLPISSLDEAITALRV